MIPIPAFFSDYQRPIDRELRRLVPDEGEAVQRSMAYTLLAPSKRVRPVLTLLSAELCGGTAQRALPIAAAIELVHAASLILDDLPSMDDAPLRRGRAANHREFGEAIAILAAFALLNLSFGTVAGACEPGVSARIAALLSDAVGTDGLVGGQAADLLATDRQIGFESLERIHRGKTGALFVAASSAGAITAGAPPEAVASLAAYAKNLGLAFQIVDDLLDVEGDPAQTGKAVREDARKTTFVSFSGVSGARQLARELCETADRALVPFGPRADRLRELSAFVAGRSL
ncbi:MAG TPA: polyprenyl synthetase family protein [Vicinamibacterales bacterium]|nr:polyprenyl synthetase family protein [Vicinamibacterales bacterium]